MSRLKEKFEKEIRPTLKKELGLSSLMDVPKLEKVVLNVGLGKYLKNKEVLDQIKEDLMIITGQRPVETKAKKSISSFKIREGLTVGYKVTLRGKRMYDFIDRLVSVALPRIRDFRGLPESAFDKRGNYSIGILEQEVFPEVKHEDLSAAFGFEVNIATSAENEKEGTALLKALGFPLSKRAVKRQAEMLETEDQESRAQAMKKKVQGMLSQQTKK
jgi:large subunit ribosomal protein L5